MSTTWHPITDEITQEGLYLFRIDFGKERPSLPLSRNMEYAQHLKSFLAEEYAPERISWAHIPYHTLETDSMEP
jgi:hypothetical protein